MKSFSCYALSALIALTFYSCDQPETGELLNVPTDETYSLAFQVDSLISAVVFCNECNGQYEAGADGSISVALLGCTKIYCGESRIQDIFPLALGGAMTWSIVGDKLTIEYGYLEENGLLNFESGGIFDNEDVLPIVGVLWKLSSIQLDG